MIRKDVTYLQCCLIKIRKLFAFVLGNVNIFVIESARRREALSAKTIRFMPLVSAKNERSLMCDKCLLIIKYRMML